MSDIAIRVENLSKVYRIGARQNRHDTLRDVISDFGFRIGFVAPQIRNPNSDHIWALKGVSFEACPERSRRVKRGEVVGIPSASLRTGIGHNGVGNPRKSARTKSTLLRIL